MKLFDSFSNDSDYTKEEMKKLEVQYLEICARIRNSEDYSTEEAEELIDKITKVGRNLYEPWKPNMIIDFYNLVDELID